MANFLVRHYRSIFTVLLIVMLFLAFFLGFLTGKQQVPPAVALHCASDVLEKLTVPTQKLSAKAVAGESIALKPTSGAFVGSKNGTKYYRPNCGTVSRIKPANYVWFDTEQDAQLQGYTQGSC